MRRPSRKRPVPPSDLSEESEALAAVEVELRYEGYVRRERERADRLREQEAFSLAGDLPYAGFKSLRKEAREKLGRVRPNTLGQAGRIPRCVPFRPPKPHAGGAAASPPRGVAGLRESSCRQHLTQTPGLSGLRDSRGVPRGTSPLLEVYCREGRFWFSPRDEGKLGVVLQGHTPCEERVA